MAISKGKRPRGDEGARGNHTDDSITEGRVGLTERVTDEREAVADDGLPPILPAILEKDRLPKQPPELIRGVLRIGHKMTITASSKAGKTWALIELALAIATGGKWLGLRCSEGRVLYVDFETDPASFQHRLFATAKAMSVESAAGGNVDVWLLRGKVRDLEQITEALTNRVSRGEYAAVILDPLYKIQPGDENSAGDIARFTNSVDALCEKQGCSVIMSHHHNKSGGARAAMNRGSGSGVFARDPDALIDFSELGGITAEAYEQGRKLDGLKTSAFLRAFRVEPTLREFRPKAPFDVWFGCPLHVRDESGVLSAFNPEGLSKKTDEQKRLETLAKQNELDSACERLMRDRDEFNRRELVAELADTPGLTSLNSIKAWLDSSAKFECVTRGNRAVVRRIGD